MWPPLVLPTVRVLLRTVLLMPTARALHQVGGVDVEGAVGDSSGAVVAGDVVGEGVAGNAGGDAVGEGGVGGAPVAGAAGVALMVRVLRGMLRFAVSLVTTLLRVLRLMVLGVGSRHSWRRAW